MEKCNIGEGDSSEDSSCADPDANTSGEDKVEGLEMEVEKSNQPPPENHLIKIELGLSIYNSSPTIADKISNPEFVVDSDVDEGFVTEQNLTDVLGSEAVLMITTSNFSAATTVRRATRKRVIPKSGFMIRKRLRGVRVMMGRKRMVDWLN